MTMIDQRISPTTTTTATVATDAPTEMTTATLATGKCQ